MTSEMVLAVVRHALTFGGGFLVSGGYATTDEVQGGIGAVMTVIGLVWSFYRKWKRGTPA